MNGQKPTIGSLANIGQNKIVFLLTPNMIDYKSNNFSSITSWLRD